jgi:tetratricopeptide (TPR) repeat protein
MNVMDCHKLVAPGWCFVLVCLGLMLGQAAPLCAETAAPTDNDDRTEQARTLFLRGLELADQESWQEAIDSFHEALALRDAPAIRYNLAASLSRHEDFVEAAAQLDLVLASDESPPPLRQRAQELLDQIDEHTARVQIMVEEYEYALEIQLDGEPIPSSSIGVPVRASPGRHHVTAVSSRTEVANQRVNLRAGTTEVVTLYPRSGTAAPASAVTSAAAGDDDGNRAARRRALLRDWRLWLGVGAGVVFTALALGLSLGIEAESEDPIPGNMEPRILAWP